MQNYQDVLERLRQAQGEPSKTTVTLVPGIEVVIGKASALDVLRVGNERDQVKQVIWLLTLAEFDHKLSYEEAEEIAKLIPGSEAIRVMGELTAAMQIDSVIDIDAKKDFLGETPSLETSSESALHSGNGQMSESLEASQAMPLS